MNETQNESKLIFRFCKVDSAICDIEHVAHALDESGNLFGVITVSIYDNEITDYYAVTIDAIKNNTLGGESHGDASIEAAMLNLEHLYTSGKLLHDYFTS
jgi:hypothetical protein